MRSRQHKPETSFHELRFAEYSICGTVDYWAPEVFVNPLSGYSYAIDWWALGIICFELLTDQALFGPTGVTEETKKMNIIAGKIDYPDHISQNARDFINKLLIPDPSERLGSRGGLKELKEHPFLASIDWMKVATRTNDPVKKFTIPLSFEPEVLIEASESSSLHFDLSDNTENIEMLFENFHYAHPSEVQEANGTLSTACQRFLPIPPSVYFCVPNKGPHLKYSVWYNTSRKGEYTEPKIWKSLKTKTKHIIDLVTKYEMNEYLFMVHDSWLSGGHFFGGLNRHTNFTMQKTILIVKQLISILAWFHRNGYTHGNFVPRNIVWTGNRVGSIKLKDFSASRYFGSAKKGFVLREETEFREAMAADQRRLGVIIFVLFTGQVPECVFHTNKCDCDKTDKLCSWKFLPTRLMFSNGLSSLSLDYVLSEFHWFGENDWENHEVIGTIEKNGIVRTMERMDRVMDHLDRLATGKTRLSACNRSLIRSVEGNFKTTFRDFQQSFKWDSNAFFKPSLFVDDAHWRCVLLAGNKELRSLFRSVRVSKRKLDLVDKEKSSQFGKRKRLLFVKNAC
ncbi:hypothetical protein ACOME3_003773 [Neoechinorhynchus agilis]